MIACPDCGATAIHVVAATPVATGERLAQHARLTADGFAVSGATGDLARFGFGCGADTPAPDDVTLQLTLTVTYAPHGELLADLADNLTALVRQALNHGLLTGDLDAEVTDYTAQVARVTPGGLAPVA